MTIDLSLNEVAATARRATRGAGYDWGHAENAGRATRALCRFGLDGAAALAQVLTALDGANGRELVPVELLDAQRLPGGDEPPQGEADIWSGAAGALCPIRTGTALADFAPLLFERDLVLENVHVPVLLLPSLINAARARDCTATLSFADQVFVTDGAQVSLTGPDLLSGPLTARVSWRGELSAPCPPETRARTSAQTYATLNAFAHRTYAPATEESRLLGAGAGVSDND